MANYEASCRNHAEGDLQFMPRRPASGQVTQRLKVENLTRCLEHFFANDLRTLRNGAEAALSRSLACGIHAAIMTSPECPGQGTCGDVHFRVSGVEQELDQLLKACSDIIRQRDSLSRAEKYQAGAFFLGRFLRIGAFSNGNGRTGRLLTSVLLMRLGAADVPLRFDLPRDSGKRFKEALDIARTVEWRGDWREAMASEALRELAGFLRDAEESTSRLRNPEAADREM